MIEKRGWQAMGAGIGTGSDWRVALSTALEGATQAPDLAIVFASHHYQSSFREILGRIKDEVSPRLMVGCSGQAIIGPGREVEGTPALSVMTLSLPGAIFLPKHLTLEQCRDATPEALRGLLGPGEDGVNSWLMFADPFTFDVDGFVATMGEAFPGMPIVGGMASGAPTIRMTHVFHGEDAIPFGAVVVGVGGLWKLEAVVSQGAEPLGQAWTITEAERNVVRTIGGRSALEVLTETMQALPGDVRERAARNLLVGLAIDEYRDEFRRGDFLIRNIMGGDRDSGAIAIGAYPRVGQTIQFHMRDAEAADDELRLMLEAAGLAMHGAGPAGAVVCSCNGRGAGLFGAPDHDAAAIEERFAGLPVAGFFCNGEIGPVGGANFVHGFTASIGFFVPAG